MPRHGAVVLPEGHLADRGEFRRDRPRGFQRQQHFGQVGEGLEQDQIDPGLRQPADLLGEDGAGVLLLEPSIRLHADAQRTDRTSDVNVVSVRRRARQLDPGADDRRLLVFQPELRQLEAVRAEGVRLDDLRARLDVSPVNLADQLRVDQVLAVEALVHARAARVQQRAHRAVGEQRTPLADLFEKGFHAYPFNSYTARTG